MDRTIRLSFRDLWTYGEDTATRLPLRSLGGGYGHIHGRLDFEVGGRLLPHLGYFGPDDVCFGEWLRELQTALPNSRQTPTAVT